MSAARPLRRRSAPPRGDSPQGEGGVMPAAQPLRMHPDLREAT
jgi:hypothetical protein